MKRTDYACKKQHSNIRRILQENPRSKRPLVRPKLRWEYATRNNLQNRIGVVVNVMETETGMMKQMIADYY